MTAQEWYAERRALYDDIASLTEQLAHALAVNHVLRWHNATLAQGVAELLPDEAESRQTDSLTQGETA